MAMAYSAPVRIDRAKAEDDGSLTLVLNNGAQRVEIRGAYIESWSADSTYMPYVPVVGGANFVREPTEYECKLHLRGHAVRLLPDKPLNINVNIKGNTMNMSTAILLINKNCRAMMCIYETKESMGGNKEPPQTMFKTFDPALKVDDYVLVPTETRHKMTVVKIAAADVEVDFDSTIEVPWIIGKIDTTGYQKTLAQEGDALKLIKTAQDTKKRNELAKTLLDAVDPAALNALPIAKAGNGAAIAPPVTPPKA